MKRERKKLNRRTLVIAIIILVFIINSIGRRTPSPELSDKNDVKSKRRSRSRSKGSRSRSPSHGKRRRSRSRGHYSPDRRYGR